MSDQPDKTKSASHNLRKLESSLLMHKVLIAYKYVPQYRAAFFEQLRERLAEDDVELTLVYGDTTPSERLKGDASTLPWAKFIPNRFIVILGRYLIYQPFLLFSGKFDLVVVEQANRLLINPMLVVLHRLGLRNVAFWGHGKNFQNEEVGLARLLKNIQSRNVGWWFAYNDTSAKVVMELGFPSKRISRVMNTIDSRGLSRHLESVSAVEVEALSNKLHISTDHVCVYVGGMYDKKRLDFLFGACLEIKHRVPAFRMIFLGSGPEQHKVRSFAECHSWCFFEGPQFGKDKAAYLKLAKMILMPGLVGLAVIDSFVARVPIVTTNIPYHSPEIEYLKSGVNGIMVSDAESVDAYATEVCSLLMDDHTLERLKEGCASSADMYSMTQMVERFAGGIQGALCR